LIAFSAISLPAAAQTTAPSEWTWVGGSSKLNQAGVYGTLGTPAAGNVPGSRSSSTSWIDGNGNFWLFGGVGEDMNGHIGWLNDLWEFNPSTAQWTWIGGADTAPANGDLQAGTYGTLGTAAADNFPGTRIQAATWTDQNGNLWLFGGEGADANGDGSYLNDLWEFSPASKEWAWMGGSNSVGAGCGPTSSCAQPGIYGTMGTAATGNIPGGRVTATTWVDANGHFWLFGGFGRASNSPLDELNDLWEFNPSTNEWTWVSGSNSVSGFNTGQPGVYGTLGTPAVGNVPGGREGAAGWSDSSGNLWLFGGDVGGSSFFNDLWEFNPTTTEWTWMGGASTVTCFPSQGNFCGNPGAYGALGAPAAANSPGSHSDAAHWTDSNGHFWLFGGNGFDANDTYGLLNDFWLFNPSTDQWAWMDGSSALPGFNTSEPGVYGTLGEPGPGNVPGSRAAASSWTDANGLLWLFGGGQFGGGLNDLWVYQPYPSAATPTFSVGTGSYSSALSVTLSDSTTGATIYYTTNGTTPTTSSTQYTGAIPVSSSETIEAIATASGYVASPVASATYTIPPDFAVAINPASLSVQSGQSATTTITVQDENGFNSNVSFTCAGLPAGATCSFSALTVPTPAGVSFTTLTVSTAATTAALHRNSRPLLPGSAPAIALCCLVWRKRRSLPVLLLLAVSFAGIGLLTGCGAGSPGGGGSSPVTSTITVTATSGSLSHTTTFTLTVN
jgi:N-acetylneuraminic acid mutarotase